jgi:hypothetical protein
MRAVLWGWSFRFDAPAIKIPAGNRIGPNAKVR